MRGKRRPPTAKTATGFAAARLLLAEALFPSILLLLVLTRCPSPSLAFSSSSTSTSCTRRTTCYRRPAFVVVVGGGDSDGTSTALVPSRARRTSSSLTTAGRRQNNAAAATRLWAKKKKKPASAAASAALEALEALEAAADSTTTTTSVLDEPLSKKEQRELEKRRKKEQQLQEQQQQQQPKNGAKVSEAKDANGAASAAQQPTSKKEEMLAKALEMERLDEERAAAAAASDDGSPKLSKKELKALKKKEEKLAAKAAKKAAKKQQQQQQGIEEEEEEQNAAVLDSASSEDVVVVNGSVEPAAAVAEAGDDAASTFDASGPPVDDADAAGREPEAPEGTELTLEEKIRRERPPPRVRVVESPQPDYTALRLEGVGVTFRDQTVLKDVAWGVQTGDRIGLVGANGAGKTTQLRVMAGELEPTTGDVVKSRADLRVAVLRQEFVDELVPDRTLRDEFASVFEEENGILNELKDLEHKLSETAADDADAMQEILDRMQELQSEADRKGAYALESRVQKAMDLMGFTADEAEDAVASFSGGWKMRIGLGKVLLQDPNVLLLDEPTNHLDLDSVEWLEAFLRQQQNLPMVIVSHDREFLDQVCTKIVDAEGGGACQEYDGNYSRFLQLKKARMESWRSAWQAQEKKIKEERKWINKFKVKQPQAVKQRQAKLEKFVKSDEYVKKPPHEGKPFRFRFPDAPRLSPEVAHVRGMSHSYSNEATTNRLFDDVELFIEKGDRIAVLGPNGSGKSTLLRLLTGREEPDAGSAEIVGQNVVCNYFEQNQADALDLSKTVLETIQGASHGQSYNELRALLGQFLFKGDAVDKKVLYLSGGEKARLSLCCMMLQAANVLVLDEPTNHLDIPAKEMLEEALQHFAGSLVVVSHDRYFISKVATTIVAIEDKKLVKYAGDYKFYMDRSKHVKEKVEARYVSGVQRIGSAPIIDLEAVTVQGGKKKKFGGAKTAHLVSRKDKGVKNAKRMR